MSNAPLNPDGILQSIVNVIDGAEVMRRVLPVLLATTHEHNARLHELAPHKARQIREADARLLESLESLASDLLRTAEQMRTIFAGEGD